MKVRLQRSQGGYRLRYGLSGQGKGHRGQTVAWSCHCHVMVLLQVWGYYIIDPVTAVAEHQRNSYDNSFDHSLLHETNTLQLIHCISLKLIHCLVLKRYIHTLSFFETNIVGYIPLGACAHRRLRYLFCAAGYAVVYERQALEIMKSTKVQTLGANQIYVRDWSCASEKLANTTTAASRHLK